MRLGLKRGMRVDDAMRARILAADRAVRARKAAAAYCAANPRTRLELERYLEQKGFDAAAREAAIESLTESGTLDETRTTDVTIRRRRRARFGPLRIQAELQARGVAPSRVEKRLAEALDGVDLQTECDELAERAAARYQPLTDVRQRRKLEQYLLRRGYEGEMVRAAVGKACRKAGAPEGDTEDAGI